MNELVYQEAQAGQQVVLSRAKMLVIKLEANPSTGYSWAVESADRNVLRQLNAPAAGQAAECVYANNRPMPGAACTQILRFAGVSAGRANLELAYRRPWEKTREPAKTYSLEVQSRGEFFGKYVPPKDIVSPKYVRPKTGTGKAAQTNRVLPVYFDWYDSGVVTWVKDQGTCGSCWAFGASAVVESKIFIADMVERDLSEQYLVSCNTDGFGCAGGWWTYDYFIDNTGYDTQAGAVYESDFPYYGYDAACSPPWTHHEKLTSWAYIDDVPDGQIPQYEHWPTVDQIKQKIYDHGPVGTVVCSNTWSGYGGGIFYNHCTTPTHIVAITGWDDGQGVFYIKNSWGSYWGEGGYMRLPYDYCLVGYQSTYALYNTGALAEFEGNPTMIAPGGSVQFTDLSAGSPTSWSWSFPGGTPSTSTAQNPLVTYNTEGTYDVSLTASNAQGTNTVTKTGYITVSSAPPPPPPLVYCDSASTSCEYEWIEGVQIGSFTNTSTASTYTDFTNLTVNMSPGETVQVTLTPGFYSWSDPEYWTIWIDWNKDGDFADPGEDAFSDWSETVLSGSFIVPASASGTTRMRVSMSYDVAPPSCGSIDYGEVEDYTVAVQSANQSPVARVNGPYSGTANTPISFSSAGSSDPDGSIASYFWDFGDHTTSTAANPSHTYSAAGTYTVALTVTDDQGATGSDFTTATITSGANQPPVARANGPYTGAVNAAVSFTSAGSSDPDGSIASYLWDFGDHTTSTAANPSHTYSIAGTFTVRLTVTDNQGASATDTTTAAIIGGPAPNELVNGQPVTVSGTPAEWKHFYINVPAGAGNLTMQISGGTGDADLYTRFGSEPTASTYDCRPYLHGNNETCTVASPQAGAYYVSLYGYQAFSNVQLLASY